MLLKSFPITTRNIHDWLNNKREFIDALTAETFIFVIYNKFRVPDAIGEYHKTFKIKY